MTDVPDSPPPVDAKLVFLSGGLAGQSFDVGSDDVTIGRDPDQMIRVESDELVVSGAHATIRWEDDRHVLRDNDSRNGTLVNGHEIRERELFSADVITFGPGGPTARFVMAGAQLTMSTIEVGPRRSPRRIVRDAKVRLRRRGTGSGGVALIREVVRLAYRRSTIRGRWTAMVLLLVLVAVPVIWQVTRTRSDARLQGTLAAFAASVEENQSQLVADLATVQAAYDSLKNAVDESRDAIEGNRQFGRLVTENYSRGVALIVFSWGFVERGGSRWLRYRVDGGGTPRMRMGPDGRPVPDVGFDGDGPIVERSGTATGFLVHAGGWLVTNRHVARPWASDGEAQPDLQPRFRVLRAYFPPGDVSSTLRVVSVSADPEVDLAVLRTSNGPVTAPVLPIAPRDSATAPGDALVFIGYPTGVHNLMFRVSEDERDAILERAGEDILALAAELARRGLVQPLTTGGSVSDTTGVEVIHTASTTGGGSGGPLIGSGQWVVAVHYAAVQSPIRGDPFRTHRGVQVRHVWDLLPEEALQPVPADSTER